MYNREYTPERITELKPGEIFVFGSNLAGFRIYFRYHSVKMAITINGEKDSEFLNFLRFRT